MHVKDQWWRGGQPSSASVYRFDSSLIFCLYPATIHLYTDAESLTYSGSSDGHN